MRYLLLPLCLAVAVLEAIQAPVGSLICPGPVKFNGVTLTAATVYTWPVLPEDEIETYGVSASILFPDHSRVILGPATRVKLRLIHNPSREQLTAVLLAGELGYSIPPGSQLQITARGQAVTAASGVIALHDGKVTLRAGTLALSKAEIPLRVLPSLGAYQP